MSFFHRCAVGLFETSSLEIGKHLQVAQPLDRGLVEALARQYGVPSDEAGPRAAMRWQEEGYVVVEYIALSVVQERMQFARALMRATGATAVEIDGDRLMSVTQGPLASTRREREPVRRLDGELRALQAGSRSGRLLARARR